MKVMFTKFILTVGFVVPALSASAEAACPPILKNLKTDHLRTGDLCSTYERYHKALAEMEAKGLVPAERVGNLHAPRMINMPSWKKNREEQNFSPWRVYKPAPQTWGGWENGAAIVDKVIAENLKTNRMQPISIDYVKSLQASSMTNMVKAPGKFRDHGEVGLALVRENSLTAAQAKAMLQSEYKSLLKPGQPLTEWRATQCWEDRTPQFRQQWTGFYTQQWPQIPANQFWTDAKGEQRQCGYIIYADMNEVEPQMKLWEKEINEKLATWGTPAASGDPLLLASRAQRWFISIHPFLDGNGRTSRFIMETIIKSLGLPAPLLSNMDEDIYHTEEEWAKEIGEGLHRAIKYAEYCAKKPDGMGCNIVPKTAPPEGHVKFTK